MSALNHMMSWDECCDRAAEAGEPTYEGIPSTPSPLATVKAYRRTGCAVITIERNGRARRHTVSLRRYRAFYFWTIEKCPWKCNGAWMRHGMDIRVLQERLQVNF